MFEKKFSHILHIVSSESCLLVLSCDAKHGSGVNFRGTLRKLANSRAVKANKEHWDQRQKEPLLNFSGISCRRIHIL